MSPRSALAYATAQRYIVLVVNLGAMMILARLLTPVEIGIYSVGYAVIAVAHQLRDAGVPAYIMQERELTEERMRTAITLLIGASWSVAIALALGRGIIASIYGNPGLEQLLLVMALNFVVLPFGVPLLATLQRAMAFDKLFVIHLCAGIGGAWLSVALAWGGHSYMSLAWGSLATVSITAVVAFLYEPKAAFFRPRFKEIGRVGSVGSLVIVVNLATTIAAQSPELIIGRLLGFYSVGIFSRARGQINLFAERIMPSIASVALPLLAKKHRNDEPLASVYLTIVTYVTSLAWPFYAGLGILCFPITRIMFGTQWDEAVPLVQILCVGAAIAAISPVHVNVLSAMGRLKQLCKAELFVQFLTILLCFAAALLGLWYVAASSIVVGAILVAIYGRLLGRVIGIGWKDIGKALVPSAKLLAWSSVGPIVVVLTVGTRPESIWPCFILGGGSLALGWLAGVYAGDHPFKGEIARMLKFRRKR